jgi:hypothetical protein
MSDPTADLAAYRLCETAQLLIDAEQRLVETPCYLACNLDTIGQHEAAPIYIGLMPDATQTSVHGERLPPAALVESELGPMIDHDLAGQRDELGRALQRLPRRGMHADTVVAALERMLTTFI